MKRLRLRLAFVPTWDGVIQKWAASYIRRNQWRCDCIHSFEDLLQEAALIFTKLVKRYPNVTERKHFMALFKTSLKNAIHDHSRYVKRKRTFGVEVPFEEGRIVADNTYLTALLAEAPDEVKLALMLLDTEPEEVRKNLPQQRENLNMRLCRVAGLDDVDVDFTGALKAFLTE